MAGLAVLTGMAVGIPDVAIVLLGVRLVTALPRREDGLARLLGHASLRWLGARSYPVYLLHILLLPLLELGAGILARRGVPQARLLALCATCGVALLLAHAVHLGIERPLRSARRRAGAVGDEGLGRDRARAIAGSVSPVL